MIPIQTGFDFQFAYSLKSNQILRSKLGQNTRLLNKVYYVAIDEPCKDKRSGSLILI